MFDLVLFDYDGTTLDSDGMIVATFLELYKKYRPGYVATMEHMMTFSGPPIAITLKQEFPDANFEEVLSDFLNISRGNYERYVHLYPGVEEILIELKRRGIPSGLITSKSREMTDYTFSLFGIEGYFDISICGDEVSKTKPDPEGILKAMEHFGIKDKEKVLYIGDNNIDYMSARNAGVKFGLVDYSTRKDSIEGKPDYIISSLDRLFEEVDNEKD